MITILGVIVASGSLVADMIGLFESPPPSASPSPGPSHHGPPDNDLLPYFQWMEHQTTARVEVIQAEIEALATAPVTGDRSGIAERVAELSRQKSDLESKAAYYRRAIRQLSTSS
ncbi:hypothetical protein [Herbidospora cretacea]|uniref:hypothetical protein n=1 Tax=Herbidospora cretacea TaxID=28444 RepID=UPI000AA78DAC|nr:hypothetical protein [Herbidospora cretacea]